MGFTPFARSRLVGSRCHSPLSKKTAVVVTASRSFLGRGGGGGEGKRRLTGGENTLDHHDGVSMRAMAIAAGLSTVAVAATMKLDWMSSLDATPALNMDYKEQPDASSHCCWVDTTTDPGHNQTGIKNRLDLMDFGRHHQSPNQKLNLNAFKCCNWIELLTSSLTGWITSFDHPLSSRTSPLLYAQCEAEQPSSPTLVKFPSKVLVQGGKLIQTPSLKHKSNDDATHDKIKANVLLNASQQPRIISDDNWKDSYPNFSRHGKNSLLKKYLTEQVYQQLCHVRTSNGVSLEDIIRSGVSLPFGAKPPRGVGGVYAGDAESYQTFAPLLTPLIEERHHASYRKQQLQRHRSNLNPQHLHQQQIDPDGQYVLYTRIRLARSVNGFRFPPTMDRAERRAVETLVRDCTKDWKTGRYMSVMDMSNADHEDLVQRKLLFPDPDLFDCSAGLGRDWPDGRGVYYDSTWWPSNNNATPHLMIWCNAQDHIWIISNARDGDVQGVFSRLSTAVWALETSLMLRGHGFVEDRNLGFLNSSPADIGTALRASVYVKLVQLGKQPGFDLLMHRLRLEARTEYAGTDQRYTGIFDIGNAEALGKNEVELINIMIDGVSYLIDLEKRLERGETIHIDELQ